MCLLAIVFFFNVPVSDESAVYKSVQQNIELIEKDIVISGSNLLDELQNYDFFPSMI